MKTLLLCLMTLVCFAADLPKPALAAIDKTQAAIDKIQADVNAKCNKEREALALTLGKMQDAATKASDLEGALALRKKIDEIRADIKDAQPKPKEVDAWWTRVTTAEQWDALEGQEIKISGASTDIDTKVQVPAGKSMVIIAHPSDSWSTGAAWPSVGAMGDLTAPANKGCALMAMLIISGNSLTPISKDPVVVGPMRIHLKANDGIYTDNTGEIRVKIVAVEK